ncbi:MAG: CAP domain-containing protein [Deltaproteobacteria bacterium]|nr:CAP domain-containing protein [Deltaproteobacteria bacterium]
MIDLLFSSPLPSVCLAAAFAVVAGCAKPLPEADPAAAAVVDALGPLDVGDLAQQIHVRVNAIRAREGLSQLAWNPDLARIATAHSADMRRQRYFAHDAPDGAQVTDRYSRAGYVCRVPNGPGRFLTGGENLALVHRVPRWRVWSDGRREAETVRSAGELAEETVQGWWNSPGHKANLLQPAWHSQAIGLSVTADGQVLVTQNFC